MPFHRLRAAAGAVLNIGTVTEGAAAASLQPAGYGSELCTNGTFDADITGWTAATGTVAWDASQRLKLTSTGTSTSQYAIWTSGGGVITPGALYHFSATVTVPVAGRLVIEFRDAASFVLGQEFLAAASAGANTVSGLIYAPAGCDRFRVLVYGFTPTAPINGDIAYVDDVSVKQVLGQHLNLVVPRGLTGHGVDALTIGQATMDRRLSTGAASLTTGFVRLTYFVSTKTETVTQVRINSAAAYTGGTPTLCRVGIYSADGSDNLTLMNATVNDTAMFAGANTVYTRALAAGVDLVAGQRYALGVLVVMAAGTVPTVWGCGPNVSNETATVKPRLAGVLSAQSDLPASITDASLTASIFMLYGALLP